MAERGDFRGIYTVLPEDPDFQDLGPDPQLAWFQLKLKLGASGIDVLDAAEAVIAERTGMSLERARDAIAILSETEWLIRDRNILWLRNGLRYEPSRNLNNENHRKKISTHLLTLPKRSIVNDFAAYYKLPVPFPDIGHSDGIEVPSPITEYGVRSTEDGGRREEAHSPRAREAIEKPEPPPPPEAAPDPPPDSEPEPDELAHWLGPHATVLDDCPPASDPRTRRTLFQAYGPPGMRANAWARDDGGKVPEAERPRLLALALQGYAAEGKTKLVTSEFAGMVRATVRSEEEPKSRDGMTKAEEDERERARFEAARSAQRKAKAEEQTAHAESEARAEALDRARRWLESQPKDVQARADLKTKAKATARGFRDAKIPPFLAGTILLEVVEQLRGEQTEAA